MTNSKTQPIATKSHWQTLGCSDGADLGCVHRVFELQAQQTPDATALVFEGQSYTYRQLDQRANQLGHYLRNHGVGRQTRVGLCVERSLETIVGILATIKAGGAYVPLDPAYPKERLSFMLQDSGATVLLTHSSVEQLLFDHGAEVICLDTQAPRINRQSTAPLHGKASPQDLLYLIYTSGSTGKPKGVMVNHASVLCLFQAASTCFPFDQSDVWTLFHSTSFGFSVWEIWGALLHGGRLVIVSRAERLSPRAFHDLVRRQQVTVLSQTPSGFRLFLEAEAALKKKDTPLRYIVFSGEPLEPRLLARWINRRGYQQPQLINLYALTETAGAVAYSRLGPDDLKQDTPNKIDFPFPHAQLHILDHNMQPVPSGEPGEIHIGGKAVAQGYHGLARETAERFIPDPFSPKGTARLYKTGDRGRYLGNGEIEFLGRIDHQIKIRGFRIEPAEIESVLLQYPKISAAVVTVRQDTAAWTSEELHKPSAPEKRLVAYVVADKSSAESVELSPSGMRAFLQKHLPDYMVPNSFVLVDALPLSPNGKLDRAALPAPPWTRPNLEVEYVAPRTALEKQIHTIWQIVLGFDQLGIHDDFLELGGNSLSSVQVATRVFATLGVDLSFSALFEASTIAQLAELVETIRWAVKNQEDIHLGDASGDREEGRL